MSDRLPQLQRQRALLAEHLAWLDREIAAETNRAPADTAALAPAPDIPISAEQPAVADAAADEILARYRSETANVQQDVKRGCLLYFGAAFAVVGLCVLGLYLYSSSH